MTGPVAGAVPVDLAVHLDNVGRTPAGALDAGGFNVWSNTFPGEQLPAPGSEVELGGVRFRFPSARTGEPDNVRCAEQFLEVPVGRYDWIYLVCAAERRTEDPVHLHFADGSVDPAWLRVSDFWPETPARFGERHALRCDDMHYPRHLQHRMGGSLWRTRVAVTREVALAGVRLPDNPAIHVFAVSLHHAWEVTG